MDYRSVVAKLNYENFFFDILEIQTFYNTDII